MIIKRRTEHRVRMGEFESVVISAEVELEVDVDSKAVTERVNDLLNAALEDDIKELREISDRDSYIRDWRI